MSHSDLRVAFILGDANERQWLQRRSQHGCLFHKVKLQLAELSQAASAKLQLQQPGDCVNNTVPPAKPTAYKMKTDISIKNYQINRNNMFISCYSRIKHACVLVVAIVDNCKDTQY